jgi:hypothetical protein
MDPKTKRIRKNTEVFNECESEHVCIICQSDTTSMTDDGTGYLGLIQPSKVLWPQKEVAFTVPPMKSKVDSAHVLKVDCSSCNLRVGLCGHQMHFSCYRKYFDTSQVKSAAQDFLIYDAAQGYFYCPLCRKLCNMILPVISSTLPSTSFETSKWCQWMDDVKRLVRNGELRFKRTKSAVYDDLASTMNQFRLAW